MLPVIGCILIPRKSQPRLTHKVQIESFVQYVGRIRLQFTIRSRNNIKPHAQLRIQLRFVNL